MRLFNNFILVRINLILLDVDVLIVPTYVRLYNCRCTYSNVNTLCEFVLRANGLSIKK